MISPVLIYTTDCDFKKKIESVGFIGARTAYPATYAAESVCNALNAELPGAMDAAGVKAVFKLRKFDLKTARPETMNKDALAAGVKYVVAVSEPRAFEGSQQYPASVSVGIRLYDAESGEYRAWPRIRMGSLCVIFQIVGRMPRDSGLRRMSRINWRAPWYSGAPKSTHTNATRPVCCVSRNLAMHSGNNVSISRASD